MNKGKKIKLIVPPSYEGILIVIPYGLALINYSLKKRDYDVDIEDLHMLIKRLNKNRKTVKPVIDLNYIRKLISRKGYLLERYLLDTLKNRKSLRFVRR